jgi:hypothetical protein
MKHEINAGPSMCREAKTQNAENALKEKEPVNTSESQF